MDLASTFRAEVFRPLATILVPGLIASFPYFLLAGYFHPELAEYRDKHEVAYYGIAALVLIAVGLVLEDLGSRIETAVWDKWLATKHGFTDLEEVWDKYLTLTFDKEPIGQRYLRTVLFRMKFELSFALSLPFCFIGLSWLHNVKGFFSRGFLFGLGVGMLLLMIYLLFESYRSAQVLANVRYLLTGRAPPKS